jgi:hypothetical protein
MSVEAMPALKVPDGLIFRLFQADHVPIWVEVLNMDPAICLLEPNYLLHG